jgi:hypothetical protein
MIYDPVNDQIVLFAGLTGETWLWNGDTRTWSGPVLGPGPRAGAAFAFDPIRKHAVLFGGNNMQQLFADLWAWDGAAWTELVPTAGPSPSAREGAALGWNASRGRLVLFGGQAEPTIFEDTWEWNGATWSQLPAFGPLGRFAHHLVPTADGFGVQLIGGSNGGTLEFDDVWELTWQGIQPSDRCDTLTDLDGDGLVGCDDPDCWVICDAACSPGIPDCPSATPSCADGQQGVLETCSLCTDVPCRPCGNFVCDPGETTSCPGDCPP